MHSTTARLLVQKNLSDQPVALLKEDNLKIILQNLENDFRQLTQISDNKILWDALTEEKKIENEKAKLAIIQTVNENLEKQYGVKNKTAISMTPEKTNTIFWRKVLFVFLITTDILLMSLGGYLGSIQLLQLMAPKISKISMTLISIISTAIEGTMMYSVFKPMLQKGLGITPEPPKETLAMNYGNRVNLTEKINSSMVNNPHLTQSQGPVIYQYYSGILKAFNQDMKKASLLPFKEPTSRKVARYGLSILNFGLSIAGTYFGSVMLLTAISAALIGTPIGWGIIATMITAQLLSRLFIRQNSIYSFLNPAGPEHEIARKKLDQFEDKSTGIDEDLNTMRKLNKLEKIETKQDLLRSRKNILVASAECPTFFKPGQALSDKMSEAFRKENCRRMSI